MLTAILQAFSSQGPEGLLMLLLLLMICLVSFLVYTMHRSLFFTVMQAMQQLLNEKNQLVRLVENNTRAIVKNSTAVESCSLAVRQNVLLLQQYLVKQ